MIDEGGESHQEQWSVFKVQFLPPRSLLFQSVELFLHLHQQTSTPRVEEWNGMREKKNGWEGKRDVALIFCLLPQGRLTEISFSCSFSV
ncbi:hypothetical protein CEXT_726031 [Caerostris extrusa]|uniref:Uncharacterized protein n=1 Tax=Caerostris extrusa TaxID=172846 RepID=A0AAV4M5Q3_CAEEX|nr:hypothetical protein CEXT_726031 [Caerostris extrusa]